MSARNRIDPDWLCALALWTCGWGTVEQLAAASLAWLPAVPDSDALYHLADDAISDATRHEDVSAWADRVLEDLGFPKPSPDDFRQGPVRRLLPSLPLRPSPSPRRLRRLFPAPWDFMPRGRIAT